MQGTVKFFNNSKGYGFINNDETGKEVRQIPGEQQLRLSKGISEYQNVAFNHDRPV